MLEFKNNKFVFSLAAVFIIGFLFLSGNVLRAHAVQTRENLVGYWVGSAVANDEETAIGIKIIEEGQQLQARLDLLDIGVLDWPAQNISRLENGNYQITFPSDSGLVSFTLEFSDGVAQGKWREPNQALDAQVGLTRATIQNLQQEQVSFTSEDGTTLSGLIVKPEGEGPFPAAVFVHGSGAQPKEASFFLARQLATQGIASLIFDKRGVGQSTGNWRVAGFDELASDVVAAMKTLASSSNIDPLKVGLIGFSQGGWVGPLAAQQWDQINFMVLISGPWVPPAEEGHWHVFWALTEAGFGEADIDSAEKLMLIQDQAIRSGEWDELSKSLAENQNEPWFEAGGFSAEFDPDNWVWSYYRNTMDFDPIPVFEALDVPLLGIFGANDASIPARKSMALLNQMAVSSDKPFNVILYPDANHSIRIESVGGENMRWPGYHPQFLTDLTSWIILVTKQ